LQRTGADAVMIGRAAQGRPWIFREIAHYLATGTHLPAPTPAEVRDVLLEHLDELYALYGEVQGVRIARKHLGWYSKERPQSLGFRQTVNAVDNAAEQMRLTREYFDGLAEVPALAA
jgi:tRNA-dihydrouridine synthase B